MTVNKRTIRHVLFGINFWRSFVHARLVVSQGDPDCLSLFEAVPEQHRLLAEHLTAEYRVRTERRGRTVDEWKIRPEQSDNHWLDCLVGCAVAASTQDVCCSGLKHRKHRGRKSVCHGFKSSDIACHRTRSTFSFAMADLLLIQQQRRRKFFPRAADVLHSTEYLLILLFLSEIPPVCTIEREKAGRLTHH